MYESSQDQLSKCHFLPLSLLLSYLESTSVTMTQAPDLSQAGRRLQSELGPDWPYHSSARAAGGGAGG